MKPGMLMVKKSVRETRNPRNTEEKLFIGYIDLSFDQDQKGNFLKVYKSQFNVKDYPIDRDMIAYSNTNHTMIISLFLKELPGDSVASFLEILPTVFNVVEG